VSAVSRDRELDIPGLSANTKIRDKQCSNLYQECLSVGCDKQNGNIMT